MDALAELSGHLSGSARAIVISQTDLDLRPGAPNNRIFIMKIGEGSLAAGGRGGGFGERKVKAALCYELRAGVWSKLFEAKEDALAGYDIPYYVSRIPITMSDGAETMGYGVVDRELVAELSSRSGIPSSA